MDRELATQAMEAADRRHREDQARMREEMDLKLEAADRSRERRETNARLTTLIPKYTEPCDMGCYLLGFEQVLTSEGIPVREWPTYLLSTLKGKAAELMVTVVPMEHRDSYAVTKTSLLEALGLTQHEYEDQFFHRNMALPSHPDDVVTRGAAIIAGLNLHNKTAAEILWELNMMWALRNYLKNVQRQ